MKGDRFRPGLAERHGRLTEVAPSGGGTVARGVRRPDLRLAPATPAASAPAAARVWMAGVPIDRLTTAQVVDRILADLGRGRGGWVVTPNVDVLRKAAHDPDVRALVNRADLLLADGMPVVWASRWRGEPVPERVAGSTLLWSLCAGAAATGASVFLLGGNPGVADAAGAALVSAIPDLRVVGSHCPPMGFERSPARMADIVAQLDACRPDIVLCGLSFPKQERLIAMLRDRFPSTWFLGLGMGLTFASGMAVRSPQWMQDAGLEWLHRLWREPRRLFVRYVVHDVPFAVGLLSRSAVQGRLREWSRPWVAGARTGP